MTLEQGSFQNAVAQARYERYMRERHGEIDVPRLAETMFNAGGQHAIQVMQAFSDILPRVSRIEERVAAIHQLLLAIADNDLVIAEDEEEVPF